MFTPGTKETVWTLSPIVITQILLTGLHRFYWLLLGRTGLKIKTIHVWCSFAKFWWPVCVIIHWYDEEKFDADHYWGSRGSFSCIRKQQEAMHRHWHLALSFNSHGIINTSLLCPHLLNKTHVKMETIIVWSHGKGLLVSLGCSRPCASPSWQISYI